MKKSEQIIKDSIIFSSGTYLSYIFKMITSIVIRRFLNPTVMGLFTELMLVFQYGKLHHLGILSSLDREIPYYRGKDNIEKISEIKNQGFAFCIFTSFIVATCLLLVSGYLKLIEFDNKFIYGLSLVAILIIAEIIVSYYRVILRTHNKFFFLTKFNVILSIIEAICTIILVITYGLKGVLLALILVSFIGSGYLFKYSGFRFKFSLKFKVKEISRLFKIGFPIELYSIVRMFFLSIDKFMIIFLLGRTELGLYSIGTMAYNFLMPLPKSIYNVIFPKFYEDYGKGEDINDITHYLLKPTIVFAYIFPIIIGIMIILLPLLVEYVLPKYKSGLFPAYILILSTFFYSLIFMWGYLLIALYKQIRMVQFNMMAIVISIFLNYLFVRVFKMGLNGIAFGTTLSNFILSTTFISYVFSFYTKEVKDHINLLLKLYLPLVWVLISLLLLKIFFSYKNQSVIMDFFHASFLIGGLILFCFPLLYYVNRETSILNITLKLIKDKIIVASSVKGL